MTTQPTAKIILDSISPDVEIWRPVQGFDDYEISNMGQIKRVVRAKGRGKCGLLKPSARFKKGKPTYSSVDLVNEFGTQKCLIHILVAETFIGPKIEGYEVNHKNANKTDFRVSNLEYLTPSENCKHAEKMGLRKHLAGELNGQAKLTNDKVRQIKLALNTYKKGEITDLAKKFNISPTTLSHIRTGRTWGHIVI